MHWGCLVASLASLHAGGFSQTTTTVSPSSAPAASAVTAQTTVTLPSGLQYVDLVVGDGAPANTTDTLVVHYTGKLTNGKLFDSTRDALIPTPMKFQINAGSMIRGFSEGVETMRVGGLRRIFVPSALGYGGAGKGTIPPNSDLIFDVELVDIKKP